jgi:hypothetical protein
VANPKRIGLLLGAGASCPLKLPLMTDFIPKDFRDSVTEPHARIIYDIAVNWSWSQRAEALDFEFLYTAVDAVAHLQSDDLLALAFVTRIEI